MPPHAKQLLKRVNIVEAAENVLEQIRMDSIYLKVNIEHNAAIRSIREKYGGKPWKRLRLFARFPHSERELIHKTLVEIAQKTPTINASLSLPFRTFKKQERTVGFFLTSDALESIHQDVTARLQDGFEERWKSWPPAHRHLTSTNWTYAPLMNIELPKKWSGERNADNVLWDIHQRCGGEGRSTGNVLLEGFVIKEMTRKDLTLGTREDDGGSIEIPFSNSTVDVSGGAPTSTHKSAVTF